MATKEKLPKTHDNGFYEIRMESIGGLGANVAGKIFAEAGVLGMGFNGVTFSSYGAEKKGSPVKTFVRFCDARQAIRIAAPVEFPHLLVVFHDTLIATGMAVTHGVTHETTVIVNTRHPLAQVREQVGLCGGGLGVVDAIGIAVEEKSRPNTVLLGAMTRASGFMDPDAVRKAIATELGKYPKMLKGNLRAFDRGYRELELEEFACGLEHPPEPPPRYVSPLGYENAPMGGAVVNPGNTAFRDLTPSRIGYIPHFFPEECINDGHCEYTCPDYCFVWEPGVDRKGKKGMVNKGIDYRYCKGCLRCVEACPTTALRTAVEDEEYVKEHTVPQLGREEW
ncbi:MAG: 2-oxoacid:acceptor oxidoreductase family protein [Thermoleophilia bacterium]|nr:2-oxoacid:acceptor oxidoreductase family protein [Thermoleophilia bacterium]